MGKRLPLRTPETKGHKDAHPGNAHSLNSHTQFREAIFRKNYYPNDPTTTCKVSSHSHITLPLLIGPLSPISTLVQISHLLIPEGHHVQTLCSHPTSILPFPTQMSNLVWGISVPGQAHSKPLWQLGWPPTQFSGQWDLSESPEDIWESFSLPGKRDWHLPFLLHLALDTGCDGCSCSSYFVILKEKSRESHKW